MENSVKIKRLVGIAILTALVVVLQVFSNYITFGPISITLALTPVAVGAILYGPTTGLFLGMAMGAIILTAPSTGGFLGINAFATVVLCLAKTGLAGFASGWVFKGIAHFVAKEKDENKKKVLYAVAATAATIIIPVINTFIFAFGASIFFKSAFGLDASNMGSALWAIIGMVFATNFVIELAVNTVLSPAVITITKVLTRKYDLGFKNDFSLLITQDDEDSFSNEAVTEA